MTLHDWGKVEMVLRAILFGAFLVANIIVILIAAQRFLTAVICRRNNSKKDDNHNKSAHTENHSYVIYRNSSTMLK